MQQQVKTVSGKTPTIPAAFRVPIDIYPKIIKFVRKNGTNVSAATTQLWIEKLAEGGNENESHK